MSNKINTTIAVSSLELKRLKYLAVVQDKSVGEVLKEVLDHHFEKEKDSLSTKVQEIENPSNFSDVTNNTKEGEVSSMKV